MPLDYYSVIFQILQFLLMLQFMDKIFDLNSVLYSSSMVFLSDWYVKQSVNQFASCFPGNFSAFLCVSWACFNFLSMCLLMSLLMSCTMYTALFSRFICQCSAIPLIIVYLIDLSANSSVKCLSRFCSFLCQSHPYQHVNACMCLFANNLLSSFLISKIR